MPLPLNPLYLPCPWTLRICPALEPCSVFALPLNHLSPLPLPLNPLEIPVVEGDDATVATVLQMVAISGYIFGLRSQIDEMAPRASKAPKVSYPEWYKGGRPGSLLG